MQESLSNASVRKPKKLLMRSKTSKTVKVYKGGTYGYCPFLFDIFKEALWNATFMTDRLKNSADV